MRRTTLLPVLLLAAAAGCSSSSSGPALPTIPAAHTFQLAGFSPSGLIRPGKETDLAFTIMQPSGKPLTSYKTGAGPHTGVHLLIVRDDLALIIHRHPPIGPDGRVVQPVDFPAPGRYRVLVDAYPKLARMPNFQLHQNVRVAGAYRPRPLPGFRSTVTVAGYRFVLHGRPRLRAIEPATFVATVSDPRGRPARFTPWYGALAHAIFFRTHSLDYFHTHVCGPSTPGCASTLGGIRVTGRSSTPGRLNVGVLLPVSGVWRLFLQCRVNGHVLTAPFTLRVR